MSDLKIIPSRSQVILHDQVRNNLEWMTVTVAVREHGPEKTADADCVGLALSVTSSFGAFGYEWGNIQRQGSVAAAQAAIDFLLHIDRDTFLDRLLHGDQAEPDFEKTIAEARRRASSLLEEHDPDSRDAERLRLSILALEDGIEDIDSNHCDSHRVSLLLETQALWDLFPHDAHEIRQDGPSRRRREGEGFYDRLWHPYLAHLSTGGTPDRGTQ